MWSSETFASLNLLLDYLNAHRIQAERCKIVVLEAAPGGPGYHLLMQTEGDLDPPVLAVAQGEAEAPTAPERGPVVDEAEAIIHDAQSDE